MSRYGLWMEDENLEVFLGFEEGLGTFFVTIADARVCIGESGSYIFHNYDHHPGMSMTLEEVVRTCHRFGITPPMDLIEQLMDDARRCGVETYLAPVTNQNCGLKETGGPPAEASPDARPLRVLGWQSAS